MLSRINTKVPGTLQSWCGNLAQRICNCLLGMRRRKWLWLVQSSVPIAIWPYPWKDTDLHSSQNHIFCHFYDVKRHEAKKASKGKSETSKSASHHFNYQITWLIQLRDMEVVIQNSHWSVGLSASVTSGWQMQSVVLESGQKQAKSTNLLFPVKQTKKEIVQCLSNSIHPAVTQIPPENLFLEDSVSFVTSKQLTWQLQKV